MLHYDVFCNSFYIFLIVLERFILWPSMSQAVGETIRGDLEGKRRYVLLGGASLRCSDANLLQNIPCGMNNNVVIRSVEISLYFQKILQHNDCRTRFFSKSTLGLLLFDIQHLNENWNAHKTFLFSYLYLKQKRVF